MTRLQKLLSQIKSVEELAEILGLSPSDIIRSVGVTKDGNHFINCQGNECTKCYMSENEHCICTGYSIKRYLNAELPEPVYTDTDSVKMSDDHTPIIKLRDSARKLLTTVTLEGFKQGHSAFTVYRHIDEYIDVLEDIGLFEKNELREFVTKDLSKILLNKMYGDNVK